MQIIDDAAINKHIADLFKLCKQAHQGSPERYQENRKRLLGEQKLLSDRIKLLEQQQTEKPIHKDTIQPKITELVKQQNKNKRIIDRLKRYNNDYNTANPKKFADICLQLAKLGKTHKEIETALIKCTSDYLTEADKKTNAKTGKQPYSKKARNIYSLRILTQFNRMHNAALVSNKDYQIHTLYELSKQYKENLQWLADHPNIATTKLYKNTMKETLDHERSALTEQRKTYLTKEKDITQLQQQIFELNIIKKKDPALSTDDHSTWKQLQKKINKITIPEASQEEFAEKLQKIKDNAQEICTLSPKVFQNSTDKADSSFIDNSSLLKALEIIVMSVANLVATTVNPSLFLPSYNANAQADKTTPEPSATPEVQGPAEEPPTNKPSSTGGKLQNV